jgi:hypothetical protein
MANICDFVMRVKGKRENIEKFYNTMHQNGNVYMGRGAEAEINYEDNDIAEINGWCKWSVVSALIDNAISMRTEPGKWYFGANFNFSKTQFVTLIEACRRWDIDMEVYSEESGCAFQEHYMVVDGDLVIDECVEWNEYCIDDYETKEEAERELEIEITDEEWDSKDSFISRGGFGEWNFEI